MLLDHSNGIRTYNGHLVRGGFTLLLAWCRRENPDSVEQDKNNASLNYPGIQGFDSFIIPGAVFLKLKLRYSQEQFQFRKYGPRSLNLSSGSILPPPDGNVVWREVEFTFTGCISLKRGIINILTGHLFSMTDEC